MQYMTNEEVQDFDEEIAPVIVNALRRLQQSQQCTVSDEDLERMIVGFSPTPHFKPRPHKLEDVYYQVKQTYIIKDNTIEYVDENHENCFTSYKYVQKPGCEKQALELEKYNTDLIKYLENYKSIKTAGRELFAQRFKELWY